jgi:putative hydrolase of the HAD superfamily
MELMDKNNCRAILFDAGFTLLEPWPGVGHWYAEHARAYGVNAEAGALDKAFVAAWKSARAASTRALPYGGTDEEALEFWAGVVRETFRIAGHDCPTQQSYYEEVFDAFARGDRWRLYDDVEPALELLAHRGVRVGILSNWDRRLHQVVKELGLRERVGCVLVSAEVGAEKPDERTFDAGRAAMGLGADDVMGYIGDEPEADGFGALRAGWRQCLVWRRSDKSPPAELAARSTLTECVRALLDGGGR